MTAITDIRLPIDWESFGWSPTPTLDGVTLDMGDPAWSWTPAAPAFAVLTTEKKMGTPVEGFSVDHVVLLVPDLERAIAGLGRIELAPRLRMEVSGRPAAFFRVGPVLEVIEAPVRGESLYGLALSFDGSLESLALTWKSRGLDVGTIKPAVQRGRRIMTVHGLDAGLAVMSADGVAP